MLAQCVHWGLIEKIIQKNINDSTHEALRIIGQPIIKREEKTSNNVYLASSNTLWNPNT